MKKIKYSQRLLVDFDKLVRDFLYFMTVNLVHADQGLSSHCQRRVKSLIKYSLRNSAELGQLFKDPVLSHEEFNKRRLLKNFNNTVRFFHMYLVFASQCLEHCKPDIFQGRYTKLRQHYLDFYALYLRS